MKCYWQYRCDFGHSWMLFKDCESEERPEDILCPFGHEAVTLQKGEIADLVQTTIRPATQVGDPVTGRLILKDRYYLVLSDIDQSEEKMSRKAYTWDEIIALLGRFRTLSPQQAWKIMDKIENSTEQH